MKRRDSARRKAEQRTQDRRTTGRQRLLLVVFGVGFSLVVVALVEGVLALLGVGEAPFDDPFVGFAPGVPVFERDVDADGNAVWRTADAKLSFFEPQQFAAEKPTDTLRIFAVGGSTTAGRPYDHRLAFPAWLDRYLEVAAPNRPVEVVNAGAISYASYRVALVMQELAAYDPDLFIVYTGHNEFLEERSYGDIIHRGSVMKTLSFRLARLRVARMVRSILADDGDEPETTLAAEVETRLEGWDGIDRYRRDEALEEAIVAHFEANLARMVGIARRAGAQIVFVVPASNQLDFAPFKSEHAAELGSDDTRRIDDLLMRGRALLEAGRPEAALAPLEEAVALDPAFADTHFRLGRAHVALGGHVAAKDALDLAIEHDVAPLRARQALVGRVRTVAARFGVPAIDLPAILAQDSQTRFGHGLLGNAYFLDHVHPTPAVHSRLAERLLTALGDEGLGMIDVDLSASSGPSSTTRQTIFDEVMAQVSPEDEARKDFALARVLGWAGKLAEAEAPLDRAAAVFPDDPEIRLAQAILYQKTGRDEQARTLLEDATRSAPNDARTLFNLGVVAGREGDLDTGIDALEQVVAQSPDHAEALHNLGVLLRRRGDRERRDLERSIVMLERARSAAPSIDAVHRALGLAYRRVGRLGDAIRSLERATTLAPDDAEHRLELAITLARDQQLARARGLLDALVAAPSLLAGDRAEAHFNLGKIANQEGRSADAEAAYRAALAADPDHPQAQNNLAILLAGMGDLEGALTLLQGATAGAPDYGEAHFNLGLVRVQSGDLEGGRKNLLRARDLGVTLPPELVEQLRLDRGRSEE